MALETNLVTHDIALSIPDLHSENYETFHLLLLAPDDLANSQTLPRIQHLHGLTNGYNAALLFLLNTQDSNSTSPQPSMQPFMELHVQLQTHALPLPIIPLTTPPSSDPTALPAALHAFQSSVTGARTACRWPVDAARELLPWCTVTTHAPAVAALGQQGRWQVGGQGCGYGEGQGQGQSRGVNSNDMSGALSEGVVEGVRERWVSLGELVQGISEGEVIGGADGDGMVSFWQFEFATPG
ncbi:hypothetical protein F5144DRAFT_557288 [Chaetomium tenue]|uniref:Uncharacterized protein n=1 Tax=Chaetomium tenue TaxID=1854479 RepID=A0ACB7PNG8_9PEZI|nr:hypothetical protein F5144DRAFT_557288 [Chaetomium globosum]